MKFGDYSPPSLPSVDQQRDALQKGLGRALQWALSGRLDAQPLLEACLRDLRFDAQVEDSRGDWLWSMVRALGAAQRFRVPILHALYDLSDDRSATQLCELARCYAEIGDETFRTRLYEIVDQKPFDDNPLLGEEEIIGLDGEQGFLFATRVRGRLADREWEWDDGHIISIATERFGEERVKGLLEASTDEAISRFREGWRREKQRNGERTPSQSHRERMAAIPIEEVFRAAESEDRCFWLRGWGKHACEADLQTVLQRLWTTQDPNVIAKMLRVFSARALPAFDARLIELCRHDDDEEVRRWGFRALEENEHPLIRDFALTELRSGVRDSSVVALFINNYRKGDEQLILESMEFPENECELHWLLMDIVKVLEKNPEADCFPLGVIAYASTPCENCRFHAARLLHHQQVAPEWLAEECRYDAERDCRELAEKGTGMTEPS